MKILNYVRRCKRKEGFERFSTLHAADNNKTFCGKELNEMWFVESSAGRSKEDITCRECLKIIAKNIARR